MASATSTSGNIARTALLPITLLSKAAFEPFITAPLLLILLRGPDNIRNRILDSLRNTLPSSISTNAVVKALKWLVAFGLLSRSNRLLDNVALNHGHLQRQGKRWNFDNGGRGEVILITGACMGFGFHMIKMFSARAPHAKLIVVDVSELPSELKSIPNLQFYKCDLTSESEVENTCNEILNATPPTVLINNAGIAKAQTILDTSQEWLKKEFTVNVFCHYSLIQKFLPSMLSSRKGHIVTIASTASYVAMPGLVDYCASKAAVLALHEGLSLELTHRYPNGNTINTTSVHPTFARTNLTSSWGKYLAKQQVLTPEEVADAVVKQVMQGKSGQIYVPDSIRQLTAIRGWPTWLARMVVGNYEKEVRLGT